MTSITPVLEESHYIENIWEIAGGTCSQWLYHIIILGFKINNIGNLPLQNEEVHKSINSDEPRNLECHL
jgi:hypothetical protein